MHEYGLMKDVVESALEKVRSQNLTQSGSVKEVNLAVGCLELHSEESFRQTYTVLTKDTPLENTKLNLIITPGILDCASCGRKSRYEKKLGEDHDSFPIAECPLCGTLSRVADGKGIKSIELICC